MKIWNDYVLQIPLWIMVKLFLSVHKSQKWIYMTNDFKIRKLVFNIGHKKVWTFPQLKFVSKIRFKDPLNRDHFFIQIQQGQNSS